MMSTGNIFMAKLYRVAPLVFRGISYSGVFFPSKKEFNSSNLLFEMRSHFRNSWKNVWQFRRNSFRISKGGFFLGGGGEVNIQN